jgi:hypothetical protein
MAWVVQRLLRCDKMSAQATRNGLDEETRVGDDETRLGKIAGAY